jgi:putative DNA primase/helicase
LTTQFLSDLRSIARALGGEIHSGQVLCPGPRHGPRDRSLSVRLSATAPNGFLAFSHASDDWRACRDHVAGRLGISSDGWKREKHRAAAASTIAHRKGEPREDDDRAAVALEVWRGGINPRGTLAERYLNSRALELGADIADDVLRWHPRIGAMLALFRNIRTDEPQAVSRTFLDHDGRKLGRKFLGPVGGAAMKLDANEEVTHGIHIGEGAETCLAARQLGLRPCWALGSKGAIGAFQALPGIEALTILAEPDAEWETQACAATWHEAGREVLITRTVGGKDANDVVKVRAS